MNKLDFYFIFTLPRKSLSLLKFFIIKISLPRFQLDKEDYTEIRGIRQNNCAQLSIRRGRELVQQYQQSFWER